MLCFLLCFLVSQNFFYFFFLSVFFVEFYVKLFTNFIDDFISIDELIYILINIDTLIVFHRFNDIIYRIFVFQFLFKKSHDNQCTFSSAKLELNTKIEDNMIRINDQQIVYELMKHI